MCWCRPAPLPLLWVWRPIQHNIATMLSSREFLRPSHRPNSAYPHPGAGNLGAVRGAPVAYRRARGVFLRASLRRRWSSMPAKITCIRKYARSAPISWRREPAKCRNHKALCALLANMAGLRQRKSRPSAPMSSRKFRHQRRHHHLFQKQ